MTPEELFDTMEPIDPQPARPAYPPALSDSVPGYNTRMVTPYPGAGGAIAERQIYRSSGVPVTRFTAPAPISISNSGSGTAKTSSSGTGGGGTDSKAWLLGGNQTGIVQTLGSLDANDVSGIAGGFEQWRALANGGFQVTNYFAFGGSTVQPSPPGRDTFGYVFSNFNRTIPDPVNEVRIAQNTVFITRSSPDTNEYAILSVGLPAQTTGGHVSVTNGSASVLWISGTTFDTNWAAGTAVTINSVVYFISAVADTTHLTLTTTYAGTTNANRVYDFTSLVVDRSDRFTNNQIVQIGLENMTVNGTPTLANLVNVTRSSGTAHPVNSGVFYQSGGTVVAEGLGWDIRPVNTAVVFQNMTLTDGTYRGQGTGFISEIYGEAQNQPTNFSNAWFNFAAVLSALDSTDSVWQYFGYTVGQPVVSTGAKVTQPYGLFIQNLQTGKFASDGVSDVIDDLVVAGIKIEALGTYGRIQWNGVDIRESAFNGITINGSPAQAFLTSSVSATDTNWVINLGPSLCAANYQVGDYVRCEGEIVLITVVDFVHSTLTVTRAQRGTTAYPHYGGTAPAIQGRTIQNLNTFQFGRWDGSRNGILPVTNFYIGAADGSSSGAGIRFSHLQGNGGSQIVFDYSASDYQPFRLDARTVAINSVADSVGVVNTTSAANSVVTWVSGAVFDISWPIGTTITINSVAYIILAVGSTTSLTISTNAGVQTGVAYSVFSNGIGLAGAASSNFRVRIGQSDLAHAPFGLISGSLTTTPLAGALEYNGSNWWITDATPTRGAIVTSNTGWLIGGNALTGAGSFGSSNNFDVSMGANGTERIRLVATPTTGAILLAAGTTGFAPITWTSGTLSTTPEPGALEYNGSNWWITDGTSTRAAIITTASLVTSAVTYLQGLQGGVTLTYDNSIANTATGFSLSSPSGTVGTTNGSTAVTGSGFSTTWNSGSPILIGGVQYFIASVTNATNLVLTSNYLGTTGSHAYTMAVDTLHIADANGVAGSAATSVRGFVNAAASQTFYGDKTFVGTASGTSGTGAVTVDSVVFVSGSLFDSHTAGTADLWTPLYVAAQYTDATTGAGVNETAGCRIQMFRKQATTTGDNFAVIGGEFNVGILDGSTVGITGDQIIGLRSELYIGGDSTGGGNANDKVFGIISTWGDPTFVTVFGTNARINQWWGMYVGAPPNVTSGTPALNNGLITTSARGLEIEAIAPKGGAACAAIVLDGADNAGRILWAGGGYLSENSGTIKATGNLTVTGTFTLPAQAANSVFAGPTSGGSSTPVFRSLVAADLGTGSSVTTKFLRGDLTWQTITPGTGTVTSVDLSTPTGLSISGNPITTAGTLALTWTSGSPPYFSGDSPTFNAIVFSSLFSLSGSISAGGTIAGGIVTSGNGFTGTVSPVTSITVSHGIVTAVS